MDKKKDDFLDKESNKNSENSNQKILKLDVIIESKESNIENNFNNCEQKFFKELLKPAKGSQEEKMDNLLDKPRQEEDKEFLSKNMNLPKQEEKNSKHTHYVDFYELEKMFLTYYESKSLTSPENMKSSFSNFSNQVGELKYVENLKIGKSIKYMTKTDHYENEKKIGYIVKSYWDSFDCLTASQVDIDNIECFLSETIKEYKLLQLSSPSPYTIHPIDFHFVFLKEQKILISELIEPYGGQSIRILFGKLDSIGILNILLQLIKALNFFECYHIDHNDIKTDNILVDFVLGKQPIIKIIDLDIANYQSISFNYNKGIDVKGRSPGYVAPEILQNLQFVDDPRKCQIYSMGIVMLELIEFFPNKMKLSGNKFDKLKYNEEKYNKKFLNILKNYKHPNSDTMMDKIIQIIQFCISFSPEKRLYANNLLSCVQGIESKNLNEILNQYNEIINKNPHPRSLENIIDVNIINQQIPNSNSHHNEARNLLLNNLTEKDTISKNENIKLQKQETENKIKALEVEVAKYKSQIRNQNELINEKNQFDNENYTLKWEKDNLIEVNKNLEYCITNLKLKMDNQNRLIEKLSQEQIILRKKSDSLMKKKKQLSQKLKNIQTKNCLLNVGNDLILNDIIMNLNMSKIIDISNTNSFPELVLKLYDKIMEVKANEKKVQAKFVESIPFSANALYTGPVNEDFSPEGAGMLIFENPSRKFIGEFQKGKIKNDLGFMNIEEDTYFFWKIEEGICYNPTFILPKYSVFSSKTFYVEETKNNEKFKIGKETYENGSYFEGTWKNGKREGKGKCVYSNANYYEGEFKNGSREGKGKSVFANGIYHEGEYKNDKFEGRGKFVFSDGHFYEGEYKDDKMEGKGKHIYANGTSYEGDWKNGRYDGKGKYVFANGDYYEGDFSNNKLEENGKKVFKNGEYFEGNLKNNLAEGRGKYVFSNGDYLEREFKKGKAEGQGKFYKRVGKNTVIDEGNWVANNKEGEFLIISSSCAESVKSFKNDKET